MKKQSELMYFQTGGTLPADFPTYVTRESDNILYNNLIEGKFCYILTARQMGKSSMRVQVANRLKNKGYSCVNIDLTSIGSLNTTTEQWYFSLLSKTCRDLNIDTDYLRSWWQNNRDLSPVNRYCNYIEYVILDKTTNKIIIFIDEIDSILSLDKDSFSTDDFFAVIRHCYNSRVDNPNFNRLTFALLGVATPNDMMQDPARTPFNIGYSIELESFSINSSKPLLKGLTGLNINPDELLKSIIYWTGGQPYLTQKICQSLVSNPIKNIELLEKRIENLFFQDEFEDHNLKNVNNRILLNHTYNIQMLEIIQRLLSGEKVEAVESDFAQIYLKLSGLVKNKNGYIVYSNKIYSNIFDIQWLTHSMSKIKRPFADDLQRWLELDKSEAAALRGEILEQALEWAENEELTSTENEFLNFSRLIQQQEREKEIKLLYTNRLKTRNRFLVLALIITLLMGATALYYAFESTVQADIAQREKYRALKQESIALSHLKELKQSLILMDQVDNSRIWLIEYLYQNKELCNLLRKVPTDKKIQERFDKLLDELANRSDKTMSEFVVSYLQLKSKWSSDVIENESADKQKNKKLISENEKKESSDNKVTLHKAKKSLDNFFISTEIKKQYPELIDLIYKTESMDDEERQYWFDILPSMTKDQINRLYQILDTERKKLAELETKYNPEIKQLIKKNYYKTRIVEIKKRIKDIEKNSYDRKNLFSKVSTAINETFTMKIWEEIDKEEAFKRLKKNPNDILALLYHIKFCLENKEYSKFINFSKTLIPMYENYIDIFNLSKANNQYGSLLFQNAYAHSKIEDYKKAYSISIQSLKIYNKIFENNKDIEILEDYYKKFGLSAWCAKKCGYQSELLSLYQKEVSIAEELLQYKNFDKMKVSGSFLNLSWYQLMDKQFDSAINTAKRGLNICPDYIKLYTNLSHGYLLTGQTDKAMSIYKKFNGKKIDDTTWNDIIIKDFKALKKKHISHNKMDEIEKILLLNN